MIGSTRNGIFAPEFWPLMRLKEPNVSRATDLRFECFQNEVKDDDLNNNFDPRNTEKG